MPSKTRVAISNAEDALQASLVKNLIEGDNGNSKSSRIFHFGQVINNIDNSNLNRIQVRIPIIDDVFYKNANKGAGDLNLPFCLPVSSRFIEVPEINSIVAVGLFDPSIPYLGRIYFDCVTGLSSNDLFSQLSPEQQALSDWLNAENTISSVIPKPSTTNEYNTQNNVNYNIGIRGKGNNKVQLNKTTTLISQNYSDVKNESHITLDINSYAEASNELHLRSKNGNSVEYHPVFDDKTFKYMDAMIKLFEKIVITFNSVPAISPAGPCVPSKEGMKLINEIITLKESLQEYKSLGASKKVYIN